MITRAIQLTGALPTPKPDVAKRPSAQPAHVFNDDGSIAVTAHPMFHGGMTTGEAPTYSFSNALSSLNFMTTG